MTNQMPSSSKPDLLGGVTFQSSANGFHAQRPVQAEGLSEPAVFFEYDAGKKRLSMFTQVPAEEGSRTINFNVADQIDGAKAIALTCAYGAAIPPLLAKESESLPLDAKRVRTAFRTAAETVPLADKGEPSMIKEIKSLLGPTAAMQEIATTDIKSGAFDETLEGFTLVSIKGGDPAQSVFLDEKNGLLHLKNRQGVVCGSFALNAPEEREKALETIVQNLGQEERLAQVQALAESKTVFTAVEGRNGFNGNLARSLATRLLGEERTASPIKVQPPSTQAQYHNGHKPH